MSNTAPFDGGTITQLDENTIRIASTSARPRIEKPGIVYAFCAAPMRTSAGLFNWESKDILVDNVTAHYMHGFGWLSQMCENITCQNCTFMPREGTGRLTTGYADVLHVSRAKGTFKVEDCNFSLPQDDHINVRGTFTRVDGG